MVYVLTSSACNACGWVTNPLPLQPGRTRGVACPTNLWMRVIPFSVAGTANLSIDFAGRGKVGGGCGGTDTYVGFSGNGGNTPFGRVDVWGAYRDGIWTSSTTVAVYIADTVPGVPSSVIGYRAEGTYPTNINYGEAALLKSGGAFDPGVCGTTLYATFTILDDGTVSVAASTPRTVLSAPFTGCPTTKPAKCWHTQIRRQSSFMQESEP